jgi:hypothetical protein
MSKIFNAKIVMNDKLDCYHEEDIVKQNWPYLVPFLTRRHGVNKGEINLEDGAIIITWSYKDTDEDEYTGDDEGWNEAYDYTT